MSTTTGHGPCSDWEPMLQALVDGELDAVHSLRCERHVAGCPTCAAEVRKLQAIRQTIGQANARRPAPDALRSRILAAIAAESMGGTTPLLDRPPLLRPRRCAKPSASSGAGASCRRWRPWRPPCSLS